MPDAAGKHNGRVHPNGQRRERFFVEEARYLTPLGPRKSLTIRCPMGTRF